MRKLINLNQRGHLIVLSIIWIMVQISLFSFFGFKTEWEGAKYQEDALYFLQNGSLNYVRLFFSSYSLLIALFIKAKIGLMGVLLTQLVVGFFSTYIFYKLISQLTTNKITSFITTLLFIIFPQIQMWNMHLYTESLFIYSLIIFMFLVINFKKRFWEYLILILLLTYISYQRPNGIAAALPAIIYLFLKNKKENKLLILLFIITVLAQITIMLLNIQNFNEFFFATKGQISLIGGYNALPLEGDKSNFIWIFLRAALYKSLYFISGWRPYFSTYHNFIQLSFLPIYAMSLIGFMGLYKNNRALFYYFILFIGGYSALFIFTYVNYHCRYETTILPFVVLVAGIGIEKIFIKIKVFLSS